MKRFLIFVVVTWVCALLAGPSQQMQIGVTTQSGVGPPTPDIVWYKMNEGTGTTLTNDVPGQPDAVTNGSWASGGQEFDGSTQYANTLTNVNYSSSSIVTMSAWWTLDDSSSVQVMTESSSSVDAQSPAFLLYIDSGEFITGFGTSTGGRYRSFTTPSTGVLTNIVSVYDISTMNDGTHYGVVKLYYNGVQQTPTSTNNTNTVTASAAFGNYQLALARRIIGGLYFFNGKCDDYRIYNGELSGAQISAIYSAGPQ